MTPKFYIIAAFVAICIFMVAYISISVYERFDHDSTTAQVESVQGKVGYVDSIRTVGKIESTQKDSNGSVREFPFGADKDSTWSIQGIIWSPAPPDSVAITKLTFTGSMEAIREPSGEVRLNPLTPNLTISPQPLLPKVAKVRWLYPIIGVGGFKDGRTVAPMVFGGFLIKKVYVGAVFSANNYGIQIGVKL